MSKLFSKTLVALAVIGSVFTLPASAQHLRKGEAIIYAHPDFRGPSRLIRGVEPNLKDIGFNDTVSSIEVRGSWEICVGPHFKSKCTIIDRPQHRLSLIRMNDNITSLRPVRARNAYRDQRYDTAYGRGIKSKGSITVFKDPDFRGGAISFDGAVPNLRRVRGFDDVISSIDIRRGAWLVCTDPNYRGRCEIIDGDVDYTKYIRLNDNISSLRPVSRRDRRDNRRDYRW